MNKEVAQIPSELNALERAVEKATGHSAGELRQLTLLQMRQLSERNRKMPVKIISSFPFIGRGNVMRDRLSSAAQINEAVDQALADQ